MLNEKSILITGGTGSLGKKLVQLILENYRPKKLIIFSRDELKQFEMSQRWSVNHYPSLRYFLGDVRDSERLKRACHKVDYVIHAAALKQVPAAEYNPEECIKTNIIGAMNVIEAALYNDVEKVIALSTDKACNPINLYGATKLCSDKLFTAANVYSGYHHTKFAVVRYGNVLGSRGSVIPFFKERLKTGVLPITDPRMTRFWITLDQAAHFVNMAMVRAKGDEILVPKIPSMKIVDLAEAVAPNCKQEIVGVRPGEKLHETLISIDDARNTLECEDHYVILPHPHSKAEYMDDCNGKFRVCEETFEYVSNNNANWMSVNDLKQLVDKISDDYSIEKSRWSMENIPDNNISQQ